MQMSGMLYGARLLAHVDFPAPEVLGPGAREDDIQGLIDRHKTIFIKPQFKGGVGKKSKAGLIGTACDLKTALQQKERLYFAEHRDGLVTTKANDRAHLVFLVGFRNRIVVFLDWAWAYATFDRGARLIIERRSS